MHDGTPIIGQAVEQLQLDTGVIACFRGTSAALAQCGWRSPVGLPQRIVKAANTGIASAQGDVDHRQCRFIEELFRKEQAAGLGNWGPWGPEFTAKRGAQPACAGREVRWEFL